MNMIDKEFETLVQQDYEERLNRLHLQTSWRVKELLLMQSIKGDMEGNKRQFHMPKKNGKEGARRKKCRQFLLNKTIDDVISALGHEPQEIKREMQSYTDELEDFSGRVIAGENIETYTNRNGEPLFRIPFLGGIRDPAALCIGLYLGYAMDNAYWRTETAKRYGKPMGTSRQMGVNLRKLAEERISLHRIKILVHTEERIRQLMEKGVFCLNVETSKEIVSENLLTGIGKGVCDDAAIIVSGKRYGLDAAKGTFIIDAGDTWSQYVPFVHAEKLGDRIGRKLEEAAREGKIKLPAADEVTRFIFNIQKKDYLDMSSSQVYLLKKERRKRKCALESYFNYIEGDWGRNIHLGYGESGMCLHGLLRYIEGRVL